MRGSPARLHPVGSDNAFARILLALSARREKQNALAIKNLKALTDEFPGNLVYQTEYAKALGQPIPAKISPSN